MKKEYTKRVYGNGRCYTYHYNYSHSEPLTDPKFESELPIWCRYTATERHVFIEDVSKRTCEIIDPSALGHRGRPKGSKDSYKRTRSKKGETKDA